MYRDKKQRDVWMMGFVEWFSPGLCLRDGISQDAEDDEHVFAAA